MSEEFKCPYCHMSNTFLKSSIRHIWEELQEHLISEFVIDLRSLGHPDVHYPTLRDQINYHIEKWMGKQK